MNVFETDAIARRNNSFYRFVYCLNIMLYFIFRMNNENSKLHSDVKYSFVN